MMKRRLPKAFAARPRGITLIELVVSLVILPLALAGVFGAHLAVQQILGKSRATSQAVELAQELATLLGTLPYTSTATGPTGLYANTYTANDTDITDIGGALDAAGVTDPVSTGMVDHSATELPAGVLAALTPVPTPGPQYERYWNILPVAGPLGGVGGVTIASIVRWQKQGGGYFHVAVVSTRFDPTQFRQ
jgi:Tfp pilus assembly protein PilV